MIVDLVKKDLFIQKGDGDNQGTIWATKNIDPELNRGKINVSKVLARRTNTDDEANLTEAASAFAFSDDTNDLYYAIANDRVWETSTSDPNAVWSGVSGTDTDYDRNSDIIFFNSKIYTASTAQLRSYTQSAGFSDIDTLSSSPHSMCIYANRLYVTNLDEKVYSMNTSETVSKTGSNTIDINATTGTKQVITKIAPVSNGIWIATIYSNKAGGEMIKWDGVTENTASARYELPRGAMAMTIKDDRPYIMDSLGRVRVFDGTTFSEKDRLPLLDEELDNFNSSKNQRFIHPNGMTVVNDEIYMLISNIRYDSTKDVVENLPSGIWAWNSRNGLYHKYSFVDADISGASPTITDYGASNISRAGALFRSDATGGGTVPKDDASEVLAGIKYFSDATTTKAAIGITDVDNDVIKAGYFVTSELYAEEVDEVWNDIVLGYNKLKNSTDKIIVKYRTSDDTPIYATGTWSSSSILRSTDDLSSVSEGDEVEILNGQGAGLCAHIKSITGTYRMVLNETISGVSGTCKFRTQSWKEIGKVDDTTSVSKRLGLDSTSSSWVQFKVFMVGTGRSPQLNRLTSLSRKNEEY